MLISGRYSQQKRSCGSSSS